MPIPAAVTRFNKAVLNKAVVHLSGHGWFVELEHVGRRSGHTHRVPLMAFDRGDVLTIALQHMVRVVRVVALGERRGPATEAATLYDDLSPAPPGRPIPPDSTQVSRIRPSPSTAARGIHADLTPPAGA